MAVGAQNKRTSFRMSFCFVLSVNYRCRTRPGPRTAGRRFCAVQAFCRRQNLGAGAIHLPRAFKISQDSIKITTPLGVVIFMAYPDNLDILNFHTSKQNCTQPAFWPAPLLRRTSVFAAGENLGAGMALPSRAFKYRRVEAAGTQNYRCRGTTE